MEVSHLPTLSSSAGCFSLYTSTVQPDLSGRPSANAAFPPYLVFKPPTLLLHSSYLPSPQVSGYFPMLPFPFLTRSGLFNGMPEVCEPGALNYYILSRLILYILSVSRNPTLNSSSSSNSWILSFSIRSHSLPI